LPLEPVTVRGFGPFQNSISFVTNLLKIYRVTQVQWPRRDTQARSASCISAGPVAEIDDITMLGLSAELAQGPVPPRSRAGAYSQRLPLQKTLLASEQDRLDVRQLREKCTATRQFKEAA